MVHMHICTILANRLQMSFGIGLQEWYILFKNGKFDRAVCKNGAFGGFPDQTDPPRRTDPRPSSEKMNNFEDHPPGTLHRRLRGGCGRGAGRKITWHFIISLGAIFCARLPGRDRFLIIFAVFKDRFPAITLDRLKPRISSTWELFCVGKNILFGVLQATHSLPLVCQYTPHGYGHYYSWRFFSALRCICAKMRFLEDQFEVGKCN